jgi:hypothetical protein
MTITTQIIRSVLRYLAGVLIAAGFISAGTGEAIANDPTAIAAAEHAINWALVSAGTVIGGLTEGWFARDVKKG